MIAIATRMISLSALLLTSVMAKLPEDEEAKAIALYQYVFQIFDFGVDQQRINAMTEADRVLLIKWLHSSLDDERRRGTPEDRLIDSGTATELARLDDTWGVEAFAKTFCNDPHGPLESAFDFVRNARVIPLIGEVLFRDDKPIIGEDVWADSGHLIACGGIILTMKHAPQFLPDIGIWAQQLQDAWSKPEGDIINIVREWYRANEQKLREGKFQEIRPGRTPVVKAEASDSRTLPAMDQSNEGKASKQNGQPAASNAVAQSSFELPGWALWSAGVFFTALAFGALIRWFRRSS